MTNACFLLWVPSDFSLGNVQTRRFHNGHLIPIEVFSLVLSPKPEQTTAPDDGVALSLPREN